MQAIVYYIVYPIVWFLSILPLRVTYLLSDVAAFILYYIVGYRKEVVFKNIKYAFPEKSDKEIIKIAKKSYRHFTDVFIEMVKTFTISKKELRNRYQPTNIEVLEEQYAKGNNIILLGAHYANWEWIFSVNTRIKYNGVAVYTRINNKYFDNKIKKSRARFNSTLIDGKMNQVLTENLKANKLSIYGLLSDQSPQPHRAHYWAEYFDIKVPIHTGGEMFAKKFDFTVVTFTVSKVKRGYYEITFKLLTETPRDYKDYEISDIFLRETEAHIRKAPEYYFWTHKRFKHMDKVPKEWL